MTTTYELRVVGSCPVDPSVLDEYEVTVELRDSIGVSCTARSCAARPA
jgi:hypothetical protein